jgi:hypothetical protein
VLVIDDENDNKPEARKKSSVADNWIFGLNEEI